MNRLYYYLIPLIHILNIIKYKIYRNFYRNIQTHIEIQTEICVKFSMSEHLGLAKISNENICC